MKTHASIINLKSEHLQKPVKEFLKVCKSKSVTINPSDSAKDVISLMLKDAESRVWCLGKNKVITGCVSKSDIIGAIAGVVPPSPRK